MQFVTQAQQIKTLFFPNLNAKAKLTLEIYPFPSLDMSELVLQSNDQVLTYRNGPQHWYRFSWPGNTLEDDTNLRILSAAGHEIINVEFHSLWGLFRLLRMANIRPYGQGYRVSWRLTTLAGNHATINLSLRTVPRTRLDILLSKKSINIVS